MAPAKKLNNDKNILRSLGLELKLKTTKLMIYD